MKKWLFFVFLGAVIILGTIAVFLKHNVAFHEILDKEKNEVVSDYINFYQWEEYVPQEVLDDFEEEYGIRVNMITFSDELTSKNEFLQNPEKYDLYVASDSLTKEFISLNALEKLNMNNFDNLDNINENYFTFSYDPEHIYSVPYSYGTTGIIYNKKYFNETPKLKDFWDADYEGKRGMLIDSDAYLLLLLNYVGIDGSIENTKDYAHINDFFELQKKGTFFGDYKDLNNKLINEDIWFSTNYGSEYLVTVEENANLKYGLWDGGLIWIDNMVIPKGAKNKFEAEYFMNYLLRPEVSAKIIEYSYTLTPIEEALDFVENEGLRKYEEFIKNYDLILYSKYEKNYLQGKMEDNINDFFSEGLNE